MTNNTPNTVDVNEQDTQAMVQQAIQVNAALAQQAQLIESSAKVEKQESESRQAKAEKQEAATTEAKQKNTNSETTISSSAKAPGKNEADVYGNAMLDKAGVGPAMEMAEMAWNVVKKPHDPAGGKGVKTFDNMLDSGSLTGGAAHDILGGGKGRSIRTASFNDLAGREKGIHEFTQGPDKVKGIKVEQAEGAQFTKKLELNIGLKNEAVAKLGQAKLTQEKLLAKQAGLQRVMSPGGGGSMAKLALNDYQPKPPKNIDEEAAGTATV